MTRESLPGTTEKLNEGAAKAIELQAEKEHGAHAGGHHETGVVAGSGWFLFGLVTVAVFAAKAAWKGLEWVSQKSEAGKIEFGKGGGGHEKKADHGGGGGHH